MNASRHVGCFVVGSTHHVPRTMRLQLTLASLLLTLGFAACADHSGGLIAFDGPQPPVVPGDQHAVDPVIIPGGGGGGGGGGTGGGTGGGGTGGGGSGGGGTGGGGTGGGGTGGGGGGTPGQPVPEPGTLLLVGTGLASAALMRRRRQQQAEA